MKKFFLKMNPGFIVLSILCVLTGFSFCCAGSSDSPESPETLTIYQPSVSIGDPHICSDSVDRLSLIFSVYEALVRQDNEGDFSPCLAERWMIDEDKRTWTFNLRRGVKFHNGDTLGAKDVVASLDRVLDPAIGGAFGTQGVYISYLGDAEISALDEGTLRIVTSEPMADLLDLLAAMPIGPERELEKLPKEYSGSGPYQIREQAPDRVSLEVFEPYWGTAPAYEELNWIAEPDSTERVNALLSGRADIVTGIEFSDRKTIRDQGAAVHELESGLCIIFLCNAGAGPCRDRRVRQALNYALDMERIIGEIKKGAAKPLNGYLTPLHFGHNPETPVYPYDPEKARRLLAEAGYADGLKLVFDIPSSMPDEAPQLARLMGEQYEEVGITLELIEHSDRAAYSEMVRQKNIHDACCFDSSPRSTFRVLREKIQSTRKGPWWQGYENTRVNALIEKAQRVFSFRERQEIYREIYTIISDDAPWIFLYNPIRAWGVGSRLKDWAPRADGRLFY